MIRRLIAAALVATALTSCAQMPTAPDASTVKSASISVESAVASSKCDVTSPWTCRQ